MFNQGYTLSINEKVLDSQIADKDLCMKKVKINHKGCFTLAFHGYIDVPYKSSFVKKTDYLEVSGNCGAIPIMSDYSRCDFYIDAKIPQDYCLAGFKKMSNGHYQLSVLHNYHVVFVMFKRSQIQIYRLKNIKIYAGKYHDKNQLIKMLDVCQNIWGTYER